MSESIVRDENSLFTNRLIEKVREGMPVVDAAGERLGTVADVRMGDPQAATTQGNELSQPGLLGAVGMALFGDEREPDLAGPQRSQYLRYGLIKVDGAALSGADRYVRSDLIGDVTEGTVHLTVTADRLPHEV